MKKLIIVESPTKSNTIKKFLGKEYEVKSSFGHIRDLPKGKLGIDLEKNFDPQYVIPTKSRKTVTALKKDAEKAEQTILATDEDREGEAISFHLAEILDLKNPQRIVFHEITKQAIEEALQNPRPIDENLVDAQQARRILDRLVGYKLSPFLWKKVARGLSAGRVQSSALRLVTDREREIQAFNPEEYWSIEAELQKKGALFTAQLASKEEKALPKLFIQNKEQAEGIVQELSQASYAVSSVQRRETKRNPLPPFTTSTLQQSSWNKLKFGAKLTMQTAQQLYEQGYISYHRTDSLHLSEFALAKAKDYILEHHGKDYWQDFKTYRTKQKGAQEAHEAIRPTDPTKRAEDLNLNPRQEKLYRLIWQRFMASQMSPALFDSVSADIQAGSWGLKAKGQTLKFKGFLAVYSMAYEETELPPLEEGDALNLVQLTPSQHFTQPPPRYTEATLVKALEEKGIGRPSTYASILSTNQERGYIVKDDQKRFIPTELGFAVADLLTEHFPKIVDLQFTASMEEDLDEIAEGKKEWIPMIREFYGPFAENLEKKEQEVKKQTVVEETGKPCPDCGSPLVIRLGRFGKFVACSTFPECRHTEPVEEEKLNVPCPKCGKGQLAPKRTRKGKTFYGCGAYPECDFALWDKPTGEKCTECGSLLVEKGKSTKCSNSECVNGIKKRFTKRKKSVK